MNNLIKLNIISFIILHAFLSFANSVRNINFDEEYIDMVNLDDEPVRVNPQIGQDTSTSIITTLSYPFINTDNNHMIYNNADWSTYYYKLSNISSSQLSILHIGDSHLQADIATGKTRQLLQNRFGNAGRGLISPFKLSKTNEPIDYWFRCDNQYSYSSLMKRPWQTPLKITGVSFTPNAMNFNITIGLSSKRHENKPFQLLRLHVKGDLYIDSVRADNQDITYDIDETFADHTDIIFQQPVSSVNLWLSSIDKLTIFGASLLNLDNGIVYNVIGNNGATYNSYNRMGNMGADCRIFNPDLIIISLGTNEAFGTMSDDSFYDSINKFVKDIQLCNPDAPILLVTPMECQRKGRININIKRLRDIIIKYGIENNVAVYDWYDVAGGYGASYKWIANGLMGVDRIHNTSKGYHLQGTLLYEALTHDINTY